MSVKAKAILDPTLLKESVDPTIFEFETTEQLPELTNIVGQERGRQVMKFGLNVKRQGYNLYVSGQAGTGKTTFTKSLLEQFAQRDIELFDWCYVYNFLDGNKPHVLKLPIGMGKSLRKDMEEFIESLKADIPRAFNEESYQKEKASIIREFQEKTNEIYKHLNDIAKEHGFVIRQSGSGMITVPTINGKPITEEQYQSLNERKIAEIEESSTRLQETVMQFTNELRQIEKETKKIIEQLNDKVALAAAGYHLEDLVIKYASCEEVIHYLHAVRDDILVNIGDFLEVEEDEENPLSALFKRDRDRQFPDKYTVNLLVDNSETKGAPVVIADNPNFYQLIGKIEYESRMGVMSTNFTKIKPGYLHEANGGYLIIQVKDILTNNFAWEALKRALTTKQIKIENIGEYSGLITTASLNPDAVPLDVKVVLIGNPQLYQLLYHYDEDFSKLFKIKADFDIEMDNNLENMSRLASFIHTHCEKHELNHFDRSAVAKLSEFSIRMAGHKNKLSTRFNQLVEIIYEADAWSEMDEAKIVTKAHVEKAIQEREYRSSLYEEKIQESIDEGSILIDTEGFKVGQVNGLAVYSTGQYSFGKPSRITATTFVGQSGIINIERESKLSGNLHNKGVYILSGYLGQQFAQRHPLALTAHLAFEQSYGGVDGDSASSTELYALLSSLSDVPINQGIAVTGSVNQKGEIQPIGGVNEKIEGFFAVCKNRGLTGEQGVLIPVQNVKNLMLNDEVIAAVAAGKFHIYAVETIEEGIEILTDVEAGTSDEDGDFIEGTVFKKVSDKLQSFIKFARKNKQETKD